MNLKVNETVKGYTFYFNHKDYFIVTYHERKTVRLFLAALKQMGLPCTEANARYIMQKSEKATCTLQMLPDGTLHYNISGDTFSGLGSFYDDGNTVILFVK